jgi:molecular chaperone GrpE
MKKHPRKTEPLPAGAGGDPVVAPADPAAEAAPATDGRPALVDPLAQRVRELEDEVAGARAEAAAAADRGLRTLAEFDNYRRRTERDKDEAHRRGRADVLRELLEVADNFDRALGQDHGDVPGAFLEGMRLVARGLHDLLDRKGVARIDAEGRPFDPEVHEALAMVPAPGVAPDTVVQVMQAGYRLDDRVLRPAKVIVAGPAPQAAPGEPEASAGEPGNESRPEAS